MSQFILDEQLAANEVVAPFQERHKAKRLADLRPDKHVLDDRIPEILLTLNQPTFITIDQDFWDARWCNPGYCILYFALERRSAGITPRPLAGTTAPPRVPYSGRAHGKSSLGRPDPHRVLAIAKRRTENVRVAKAKTGRLGGPCRSQAV